ncbi:hypothetical protein [Archangium lansingense]|uniref:Lipoprotein n=1 Tax=Archangium lansingense TaxID=2995310 RepID=A0ABT4AK33_9BACT|nr:hypothetical protein [Archangium lansinium]MCY1082052.1 hypothetical protein [Archangium lansinium]
MKRWLGWTMVLGLGGALATGCASRQEGTGTGGSGDQGVSMAVRENLGPYKISAPQEVPRERRNAPLGVGAGPDNARRMALEQLKNP